MNEKKKQLIKLVMELGSFFANCDDDYNQREADFLDDYVNKIAESQQLPKNELISIRETLQPSIDIKYLILETMKMQESVGKEERYPLLKTLSYFINGIIEADGIIHPNETKFYTEWKKALGMDNDINIEEYLK